MFFIQALHLGNGFEPKGTLFLTRFYISYHGFRVHQCQFMMIQPTISSNPSPMTNLRPLEWRDIWLMENGFTPGAIWPGGIIRNGILFKMSIEKMPIINMFRWLVHRGVQLLTKLKMDMFVNKVGVTGFSFGS